MEPHCSHSLKSLNRFYGGLYKGVIKGDTRSLDYRSYYSPLSKRAVPPLWGAGGR